MQGQTKTHELIFEDSTWSFVVEFSPDEISANKEEEDVLPALSFFQVVQRLGLPPESIKRIESTILENVGEMQSRSHHRFEDVPVWIRLYCSKKTADRLYHTCDPLKVGWGYYVIEKSRDFPNTSCQDPCRVVEIYLFNESE